MILCVRAQDVFETLERVLKIDALSFSVKHLSFISCISIWFASVGDSSGPGFTHAWSLAPIVSSVRFSSTFNAV